MHHYYMGLVYDWLMNLMNDVSVHFVNHRLMNLVYHFLVNDILDQRLGLISVI